MPGQTGKLKDAGRSGGGKWRAFLTALVTRPGIWAYTPFWFPTPLSAKQYASNVRRGFQSGKLPPEYPDGSPVRLPHDGTFEATWEEKPKGSGMFIVWARWMPAPGNLHTGAPATQKEIQDAITEQGGDSLPVKTAGRPTRRARR